LFGWEEAWCGINSRGNLVRTIDLFIAACSSRSSGEFFAHSISRALRALLLVVDSAIAVTYLPVSRLSTGFLLVSSSYLRSLATLDWDGAGWRVDRWRRPREWAFEVVRHVEGEREGEKEEAGEGDPSTKAKAPLVVK